jgi:SanA protein
MFRKLYTYIKKKRKRISLRKLLKRGCIALVVFIMGSYLLVETFAINRTYDKDEIEDIPHSKIGLLLGTSKNLGNRINLYYQYRIDACVELYNNGKIDYVLISGDNGTVQYNEPETMRKDLIARGIPKNKIILDYAGFRTLDSVVRCKKVFGETKVTIISQRFHNERAIFIAKVYGIDAYGYNAKKVGNNYITYTDIREVFARVKLMIDVFMGKRPKYLGEEIQIGN